VEPTPAPFINDARASSEFYSNKILVEFKKSDQDQVTFVHSFNEFLKDLATYVKKNHTTGLVWNPRGGDAASAKPAAAPKAGGAPPPPSGGPPPPPPPEAATASSSSAAAAPNPSALFDALNKGADITKGLKKVTKDMKTKNQDRSTAAPVVVEKKKEAAAPKAAAGVKKGTPKFELQDKKWVVEWQENNNNIEITGVELRHTVYIYKCEKSVVRVVGKVNSITLDSCKRVAVVFDDAVAQVELVNSISCEVQITGKVPSVAIDKCSGVQVFLSKNGLETEIVTSKSDSLNVLIPDPAGGLDPVEIAIPEQFKTLVVKGRLQTSAVEHV
jgi:adenylyl cyclase-associated protein